MEMKEMEYAVSYNNGGFSCSTGNEVFNCYDWYTQRYIPIYYPTPIYYSSYTQVRNKGEQALDIVKMLMDKNLIKKMDKVKDFVNLMDAIIKIL